MIHHRGRRLQLIEQVVKQLNKLINVLKATELKPEDSSNDAWPSYEGPGRRKPVALRSCRSWTLFLPRARHRRRSSRSRS